MFRHGLITFSAIFFAELPDKTMFATLLLATHFRRRLPVWLGVTIGYTTHVVIAVLFGSALTRLPERPIQLVVGTLFCFGGLMTWRNSADNNHDESGKWAASFSTARVIWTSASVILVAEFADLTQLATAGFAARFNDPIAVGIGAALALSSVSGLAVLTGTWLQRHIPLRAIQRVAALLFMAIGVSTIVIAIS
jgi:putative Ca2+/H+ antiporter (TMEM165/GDT1 family)